jgi:hypothetical protein
VEKAAAVAGALMLNDDFSDDVAGMLESGGIGADEAEIDAKLKARLDSLCVI